MKSNALGMLRRHGDDTADGELFEVPLPYLVLNMPEEEFGFAGDDGRITLPSYAWVMEHVMCLLRRDVSEEVES
uniref:Uncharacterized protein n=1 Tax=Oryza nivara TaxID=4536 RepID=A0A0E0IN58_ORYNI